jgi:hypothetical protein
MLARKPWAQAEARRRVESLNWKEDVMRRPPPDLARDSSSAWCCSLTACAPWRVVWRGDTLRRARATPGHGQRIVQSCMLILMLSPRRRVRT